MIYLMANQKALNQAVRRNIERFPADFMFPLSEAEKQEVVTNCDHLARLKFSPTLPYAFTEHGEGTRAAKTENGWLTRFDSI